MSYKPKFCCECGEPIQRIKWTPLTSRRFCELCETDYKFEEMIPKAVLASVILLSIISIGFFMRKAEKPLNLASVNSSNANINSVNAQTSTNSNIKTFAKIQESNSAAPATTTIQPIISPKTNLKPQKAEFEPASAQEVIYFCGAETKKGTFCTHRVKGGGRCWQHVGKPAMLPPDKLIASR
ncbi:MAG: hypothetical protein ACR2L1_08180 [Pyrinomonadaceae bacterium]